MSFDWQCSDIEVRLLKLRHAVGQSTFHVDEIESVALGATFYGMIVYLCSRVVNRWKAAA